MLETGNALDEAEHDMATSGKMLEVVFLETAGWLGIEQLTEPFPTYLRGIVASEACGWDAECPPKCRGPDYIGCAHRSKKNQSDQTLF